MFTRWCDTCQKPVACHNVDGDLHCIACKSFVESLDSAAVVA